MAGNSFGVGTVSVLAEGIKVFEGIFQALTETGAHQNQKGYSPLGYLSFTEMEQNCYHMLGMEEEGRKRTSLLFDLAPRAASTCMSNLKRRRAARIAEH